MSEFMIKYLGKSWTNKLLGIVAGAITVPAVYGAILNWSKHQPADWRGAAFGLLIAFLSFTAKASRAHSTIDEVQQSTVATSPIILNPPPAPKP